MENFVIFTLIMMLLICNSKGAGFCEVEERSMVCDGTIPQEYFGDEDMNFPDVDRFEGSNIHTERMYFPTSNFPKLEYIDIKQSSLRCEDIVTQAIVIIEDSECPRSSSSLPTTDLTTLTEETTLKIESQTSDLSSIRPTTDHPSSSHKIPDATSTITLKT